MSCAVKTFEDSNLLCISHIDWHHLSRDDLLQFGKSLAGASWCILQAFFSSAHGKSGPTFPSGTDPRGNPPRQRNLMKENGGIRGRCLLCLSSNHYWCTFLCGRHWCGWNGRASDVCHLVYIFGFLLVLVVRVLSRLCRISQQRDSSVNGAERTRWIHISGWNLSGTGKTKGNAQSVSLVSQAEVVYAMSERVVVCRHCDPLGWASDSASCWQRTIRCAQSVETAVWCANWTSHSGSQLSLVFVPSLFGRAELSWVLSVFSLRPSLICLRVDFKASCTTLI